MIWTSVALLLTLSGSGIAILAWLHRKPSDFTDRGKARVMAWAAVVSGVFWATVLFSLTAKWPNAPVDLIGSLVVVGSGGIGIATFLFGRSTTPSLLAHTATRMRVTASVVGLAGLAAFVAGLVAIVTVLPG